MEVFQFGKHCGVYVVHQKPMHFSTLGTQNPIYLLLIQLLTALSTTLHSTFTTFSLTPRWATEPEPPPGIPRQPRTALAPQKLTHERWFPYPKTAAKCPRYLFTQMLPSKICHNSDLELVDNAPSSAISWNTMQGSWCRRKIGVLNERDSQLVCWVLCCCCCYHIRNGNTHRNGCCYAYVKLMLSHA